MIYYVDMFSVDPNSAPPDTRNLGLLDLIIAVIGNQLISLSCYWFAGHAAGSKLLSPDGACYEHAAGEPAPRRIYGVAR